ncbi:hypothetical protein AAFF_G00330690 [Aldrovandia affinis]|uniref:DDE Tnp4 domain-containing protein n=1 Tax=Aldrovandia affinis TaxID=143900 RepID=A0AAD7W073_9TELE|nr:hypothetical protein AAFF_G00330690 [Aldrovandia affinis]
MLRPSGQAPSTTPEYSESTLCHSFEQEQAPGPQARFNGALRGLRVAPDRACDIIVACAVLHNVATIRKDRVPVVRVHPEDDLEPVHLDEQTGRVARDRIAHHHFG